MDKDLAEKTSLLTLRLGSLLDKNLREIQEKCSEEEAKDYIKSTAYVMGYLQIGFMNPIYEKYPELLPKELGGSYDVNTSSYDELYKRLTNQ